MISHSLIHFLDPYSRAKAVLDIDMCLELVQEPGTLRLVYRKVVGSVSFIVT